MIASKRLVMLAIEMGENRQMMLNATDDEAHDFYRCEYLLCKEKYMAELNRIKNETR